MKTLVIVSPTEYIMDNNKCKFYIVNEDFSVNDVTCDIYREMVEFMKDNTMKDYESKDMLTKITMIRGICNKGVYSKLLHFHHAERGGELYNIAQNFNLEFDITNIDVEYFSFETLKIRSFKGVETSLSEYFKNHVYHM